MSARLSPEDAEYLRRSCEASGVVIKVNDPVTVARVADLLYVEPTRPAHQRPRADRQAAA